MTRSAIWLATAALIVGAAFHAFTTKASACSCKASTPEGELEQADAVFLGELVSIRRIGQFPRNSDDHYTAFVDVLEFKVSEIWKGHPHETIYVHTYPRAYDKNVYVSSASCNGGYLFWGEEGERFVVFVSDGSVGLGYCEKSTHESKALNYFAVYGKGRPPEPESVAPMPPLPPDISALPAENPSESESAEPMPSAPPPGISAPSAENSPPSATKGRSPKPESIVPMPSPPPDISAPPAENSPAVAGRCGLPLHFVSNYGDTAALIMIVGLPGLARLISRRRTHKSSRDS